MENLVTEGERLFAEGQLEEAKELFLDILSKDPNNKEATNNLGVIYYTEQNTIEAEKYFSKAISIKDDYLDALLNIARLCQHDKRWHDTASYLERALAVNQTDPNILNQLGMVYLEVNNVSEAKKILYKSLALNPTQEVVSETLSKLEENDHHSRIAIDEPIIDTTVICPPADTVAGEKESTQIVLVWPAEMIHPTMSLLSIGTKLKESGFTVKIVSPDENERKDPRNLENFLKRHVKPGTLWVGMSVMTPMIDLALKISGIVKTFDHSIKTVWGGPHPTLFPERCASHPLIDIAVYGDGEDTTIEISEKLASGESMKSVKGIAFKSDGKVIKTGTRPFTDLELLPMPDYSLFADIDKYSQKQTALSGYTNTILPVYAGAGCPYRCSFCINTVTEKSWRRKTADQLIIEVEYLLKTYGVNAISMVDELFFADKKRALKFMELMDEKGLSFEWHAGFSIHVIDKYSDDELRNIRDHRLVLTGVGVESGAIPQLKRLKKGITPKQVLRCAERLAKADITCSYSFLIGTPLETKEEMVETLRLMHDIHQISPKHTVIYWAQIYRPYPGSSLYDKAVELGFSPPETLEGWSIMSSDYHNGFTRYEDLPWLPQGTINLINDLNQSVSVYLKRDDYVPPEPFNHFIELPNKPKQHVGDIFARFLNGTYKDSSRYSDNNLGSTESVPKQQVSKKKEIVFVKLNPQIRIFKEALALRDEGYKLTLIANRLDHRLFSDIFDEIILFKDGAELAQIVKGLSPYIFHTHAEPNSIPALVMQSTSTPVIYDAYDYAGMKYGVDELTTLEKNAEHYCLQNADGIVNKHSDEALEYFRNLGYKINAPVLRYEDYCYSEFIKPLQVKPQNPENWSLVYTGNFLPPDLPSEKYGHIQLHDLIKKLDIQGIHFHAYCNPYQIDEKSLDFYRSLEKQHTSFKLHTPVPPYRVSNEIGAYHWGSILPGQNSPLFRDAATSYTNKVASYLEAGLPILTHSWYKFTARRVEELGVGIVLDNFDMYSKIADIMEENYQRILANIHEARSMYSIDNHKHRLIDFYEQIRS